MDAANPFDRWMTFDRIARSDLMALLFSCLKDGTISGEEAREVSLAVVSGFADSDCYFLADVASSLTGRQTIGLVGRDGSLVHAVAFDPRTGFVADVMGTQPLGALRSALEEAMGGPLLVRRLPSILGEIESARYLMLVEIARGLPWLGIAGTPLPRDLWSGMVLDYATRFRRRF